MSDVTKRVRLGGSLADLDLGAIITSDGFRTELRPKTAALLRTLAARPGDLISKDEIMPSRKRSPDPDTDG